MNWETTNEDAAIIHKIAKRAFPAGDVLSVTMDLTAVHVNGNPLKLQELLDSNNSDFYHDLAGINTNIDHDTGKLQNCFLPRFSV